MHKSESLARLVNSYRYKVITGEKHIDPEAMVRNPCRHCQECAGQGCPHVMRDLPAFENWIRVDRFVSKYLNDIANLAAKGLSPDMHRSRELALANEMIDSEILDECVNAAAETEFRLFRLIPAAIAECKAVRANPKASTPARDELLLDIYRWLRPKLSLQLASNEGTLKGNVPTASVLDAWTVHFLERLELFNTEFRIQRDSALPIPSDQLVGNFLNYVSAHAQYEKLEKRRLAKRNSAQSIHSDNGQLEVADDRILSPEEVERIFQIDSLGAAIQRLPEPHRQAIEMQLAGHKLAEIAGSLGKSVGQVKNTLRSARNMLHEWMPTDD